MTRVSRTAMMEAKVEQPYLGIGTMNLGRSTRCRVGCVQTRAASVSSSSRKLGHYEDAPMAVL